ILGQAVMGYFATGQGLDDLALATLGVDGVDLADTHYIPGAQLLAGVPEPVLDHAHAILDGDHDALGADGAGQDLPAFDHGDGAFAHEHFVAGDPGLAFGAVEDDGVQVRPAPAQL